MTEMSALEQDLQAYDRDLHCALEHLKLADKLARQLRNVELQPSAQECLRLFIEARRTKPVLGTTRHKERKSRQC